MDTENYDGSHHEHPTSECGTTTSLNIIDDDNMHDANDNIHHNQQASSVNDNSSQSADQDINDRDGNNQSDGMGDAAAVFVWLYLLLILTILTGAIVIGCFVVVRYGFVILVAFVTAATALAVVAATLMSVITRDAKLTKARSTVYAWHVVVKDVVLEEINNLKEDVSAFSNGTLLLTYVDPNPDEEIYNETDVQEHECETDKTNTATQHKPKSILFKYLVSPLTKIGSKKRDKTKASRSMFKNKKKQKDIHSESHDAPSNYDPPVIV
jgi:hypothetical protein